MGIEVDEILRRRGDVHICWLDDDSFLITHQYAPTAIVPFFLSIKSIYRHASPLFRGDLPCAGGESLRFDSLVAFSLNKNSDETTLFALNGNGDLIMSDLDFTVFSLLFSER